jgi:hypothetical protein
MTARADTTVGGWTGCSRALSCAGEHPDPVYSKCWPANERQSLARASMAITRARVRIKWMALELEAAIERHEAQVKRFEKLTGISTTDGHGSTQMGNGRDFNTKQTK